MTSLHINKLRARYYLTESLFNQKGRLDRLLDEFTEQVLPGVLEDAGVSEQDEVAIRNIYVPVKVRLGMNDSVLIGEWSKAFALKIKQAIEQNDYSQVVWYPSRLRAMFDFAAHVSLLNNNYNWVWRQFGFADLQDNGSVSVMQNGLINALANEQEFIMPVVQYLAKAGLLQNMIGENKSSLWIGLVHMVTAQAGIELSGLLKMNFNMPGYGDAEGEHKYYLNTEKMLETSNLLSVIETNRDYFIHDRDACLYIVVLMLFLSEPNLFSRSHKEICSAVLQVAGELAKRYKQTKYSGNISENTDKLNADDNDPGYESQYPAGDVLIAAKPGSDNNSFYAGESGLSADSVTQYTKQLMENTTNRNNNTSYQEKIYINNEQTESLETGKPPAFSADMPMAHSHGLRSHDRPEFIITDHGGLLFIVWVLRELELYQRIASNKLLGNRPTGWVLQYIATNLISIDQDDPSLKLFCGVDPNENAYWADAEPPTEMETALIKRWCKDITDRLRSCADWPGLPDKALLEKVCLRRTKIRVEPGWIDVYFDVSTIDVNIRKAGLDLDPGYEPALGFVIKFHYE